MIEYSSEAKMNAEFMKLVQARDEVVDLRKEIERLRRMRLEFTTFVDECHTLTGSLWPQNETTGRLKDMLEELKEALDNG